MDSTFYNDRDLYEKFKKTCKKSGKSVSQVLRELEQLYVDKGEKAFK